MEKPACLRAVDPERLTQRFLTLARIESPTLGERQMADTLSNLLRQLGLTVTEDTAGAALKGSAGNLHAWLPPDRLDSLPPLLFSAHMDTVPPVEGKRPILHPEGRITSDGSTVLGADDLAGLAAILEALEIIQAQRLPHRGLELLFTVAEERHCQGSRALDYTKLRARQAYVLDLTGPVGTAAYAAPSILTFRAVFTGRAAHAGFAPETGIHAVQMAARAVSTLRLGRLHGDTTVNIGRMEGGSGTNIIPERCSLIGEVRSLSHSRALEELAVIRQTFQSAAGEFGGSCALESECALEAYAVPEDHAVVNRFREACRRLGLPFQLTATFGGSDNNHLMGHGITGLVVAGAMHQVHSTQEYTTVNELAELAGLTLELMLSRDHL